MSSPRRNAEKRKEQLERAQREEAHRTEMEVYFRELTSKLDELGIDPQLLKEYLNYID